MLKDKTQKNKNQTAAQDVLQKKNSSGAVFEFEDNRPQAVVQGKLLRLIAQ